MDVRRNRRGFTLVELLVTLALLALAVSAVGTINYVNQKETLENKLLTQLQEELRSAVDYLVPYLRMGQRLEFENDMVRIVIPRGVRATDFEFGLSGRNINYSGDMERLAGTSLWAGEQSNILCSQIAVLSITNPDESDGLVTLELVSAASIPGVSHGLPLRLTTKVLLRNWQPPK